MAAYTPTIGLEIHAELSTRTKMFFASANDPHAVDPNTHICPVCMAFPGTLPVINKEAVRHVLRVGAALKGRLADYSEFDRKNYFYPDIPKGYQISQYQYPLVAGGTLAGVAITRVHLEEDTARSQHLSDYSLIDFNRAGVPLMELVTEPVIHDAETAQHFAQEFQLLLRTLGASEANMEKGEMRVEANISVSKDSKKLGTKVEVKNLNSFRSVAGAIQFEVTRHIEVLERGERIVQETRGWDENKESTFSQRLKESSHDYRYFPDPDLPKLRLSRIAEFSLQNIVESLPELPEERRKKYSKLGVKAADAEVLISDPLYASFFSQETKGMNGEQILIATNYLLSDVRGSGAGAVEMERIAGSFRMLVTLIADGSISSRAAKDILAQMLKEGGDPNRIADQGGLLQVHDSGTIQKIVREVIAENQEVSQEVKKGKVEAVKFLMGQGMKKSKGSANPQELERIIKEELGV